MIILIATFALVFLRGVQQQNVIHGNYKFAMMTSYLIAVADVMVVLGIVDHGVGSILFMGTGGAIGVVSAMIFHRKFIRKYND